MERRKLHLIPAAGQKREPYDTRNNLKSFVLNLSLQISCPQPFTCQTTSHHPDGGKAGGRHFHCGPVAVDSAFLYGVDCWGSANVWCWAERVFRAVEDMSWNS